MRRKCPYSEVKLNSKSSSREQANFLSGSPLLCFHSRSCGVWALMTFVCGGLTRPMCPVGLSFSLTLFHMQKALAFLVGHCAQNSCFCQRQQILNWQDVDPNQSITGCNRQVFATRTERYFPAVVSSTGQSQQFSPRFPFNFVQSILGELITVICNCVS